MQQKNGKNMQKGYVLYIQYQSQCAQQGYN